MNYSVETRISKVTVYTKQALVTRLGVANLNGQEQDLVIEGLPATLQTDSVRAGGVGTVAVRLLGVRTERTYATEPVAERVAQLSQQLQQLEEQKRSVQDQLAALQLQRNFVQGLSERSVDRFSRSLAQQQVSLNETRELLNFVGQQHTELSGAIAQQEKQQHELDQQLTALRQQLRQVQTPRPKESFNIIVTVESSSPTEFELEVFYVVQAASWTPLYDLRVNGTGDRVNLSYLAEVQQSTSEDWQDVALTLSTAKPGLGTLPPKLKPWYVDTPSKIPPAMMRSRAAAPPTMALPDEIDITLVAPPAGKANFDLALEEVKRFEAQPVAAEVSKEGGVVTFDLNRGGNIPSDGTPHKITIFSDDYPCRPRYIAMPRLVSFAYLETTVMNSPSGATLVPGKANIFRDNTFVGTTQLENVAPGQEFKLNLGIDEGVKIERELVERHVDKKLIGSQRRTTYAYRLVITNLRDQEINLKLTEQLPVSRNEQIKVRLLRSNPIIQLGEMGMLEWSFALSPQSQRELYYQFTVEHPPELSVVGLDI